jgi:uncharacterized small protein (DUF1192 family)
MKNSLYSEDLTHRSTSISGKRDQDYDYAIRHLHGYPKTGFAKTGPESFPTQKEAPSIREAGDVLGKMVLELVEKQEEIDALQEEIKRIEAEAEAKKGDPRDKQKSLRGDVTELGRKVFGMLAKSVENLETGAAHFRRVQEVIVGIRESYEEKTPGSLSAADKYKNIVKFLKENHPEVMAEVDAHLDNLTAQLIAITETPRQVVTQRLESRRLYEGVGSWLQKKWAEVKNIFTSASDIESVSGAYANALEEML